MVRRDRNEVQNPSVLPEHSRNHVTQVLQEMEAISYLHGVRSGPPHRFGVLSATVPAHHLHPLMLTEPPGEAVRAPVGQNIHQCVTFEIHQYRPVAGPATEGEVVHTQDPRRSVGPKYRRTDVVEQGVSADYDPEIFQKARARFSTESEGDVREPAVEPLGSATVVRGHTWQTFRIDR
jgi:hypothetical protein